MRSGRQFMGLDFNYSCKAAVGKIQILLNYPAGGDVFIFSIYQISIAVKFDDSNSRRNKKIFLVP